MNEFDDRLILTVPSKGRLKEETLDVFAKAGFAISKDGDERGYSGVIEGYDDIRVLFSSASEIAFQLKSGKAHLGVTGEDLIRETIYDADTYVTLLQPLNFGYADVVVAVPACWLDVHTMDDVENVAAQFYAEHGRRLRVATKYRTLTQKFFYSHGILGYRIVESLGATEGAPASGIGELIVDITSTGNTLKANHLKVLKDGVVLKSQAHLVASKTLSRSQRQHEAYSYVVEKIQNVFSQ